MRKLKSVARTAMSSPLIRGAFNLVYHLLPASWKYVVWRRTAKVFRDVEPPSWSGVWRLRFAGSKLKVPLQPAQMWLNWDLAVAILGHDTEIKQFYLEGLRQRQVDTFVDIGANYGTHTLMFLCAGVRALTFEPNPHCAPTFLHMCDFNRVTPVLHAVALGAEPGNAVLSFSVRNTWRGQVGTEATGENAIPVEVRTLDEFTAAARGRVLVKIDVEGYELQVLRGARKFIRAHRPTIIFESNLDDPTRGDIHAFLSDMSYDIRTFNSPIDLKSSEFVASKATNFLSRCLE